MKGFSPDCIILKHSLKKSLLAKLEVVTISKKVVSYAVACSCLFFQASNFNRIIKLWNYVCELAPPSSFCAPNVCQIFVRKLMSTHLSRVHDFNYPCTWTLVQTCSHSRLIYTSFFLNACFYYNFRSYSRGGASHGTLSRCICLFWVLPICLLISLFICLEYPIKLIKKKNFCVFT